MAVAAAALVGGAALAATTDDLVGARVEGKKVTPDYIFGTATRSVSCLGVLSDGTGSPTVTDALDLDNASPTTELARLVSLVAPGGARLGASASRDKGSAKSFDPNGAFIALKVGKMTAYLQNSDAVRQTIGYSGNPAGGLSHQATIGDLSARPQLPPPSSTRPPVPQVPLPASLVRLGGALVAPVVSRQGA